MPGRSPASGPVGFWRDVRSNSCLLGHGLTRAQPYFDGGEFEHGKVIGDVLLVACGDTPEVLDLAEEALDVVPLLVEPGTRSRTHKQDSSA